MKKAKIFQRTLALTLAAIMLSSVSSCRHKNGVSAVSKSDAAANGQYTDEGYHYPITKRCFYDGNGKLSSYCEYEYSPEGYLLKEQYYTQDEGQIYLTNSSQYTYDEKGRMVKQISDQTAWDAEIDQWNYDRWTTTYEYDDIGRKIADEYACENFNMKERTEVIDESAMTKTDSFISRSTIVYYDDKLTGGYLSRLSSSHDTDYIAFLLDSWVDKLYDPNGALLWSKSHFDDGTAYYDEYQYDSKGRVTSRSTRYVTDAYIYEDLYSVEYDDHSRVTARTRKINDNTESWVFFYNQDGSYAGCDETDKLGDVRHERCEYNTNGELIGMTVHHECKDKNYQLSDRKKEYSDYDANGNCRTVTFYAKNDDGDWELTNKHTYEYGDKIPKGVKYGTSQDRQEEQGLAVLYFEKDERLFNEYLNREI